MIEKVIKRNGETVPFDKLRIQLAVGKALREVGSKEEWIAERIANDIAEINFPTLSVEEIQDWVENSLIEMEEVDAAKAYIKYRYKRQLVREANTTDKSIKELINGESDYWNTENSNKNAKLVTTQRDYIAGITSKDIARRFILPEHIVKAHDEGILHVHDLDYLAQNTLHNCELVNLNDMLQNGTLINGVMIDKPKRFLTACTIATQIITAVTSSSYGGCTITLTHLAPFARASREKFEVKYREWGMEESLVKEYAMRDLKKEIADGVQTFNYQVNSMTNTNGQSPFLSVFMYLGETDEYKDELALIIEEFLHQRILGFKNEKGVYVAPAFPKLLYCLEEDNIHEDSKYYYLTELAAECSSKRMVPDYISEKKMKELKLSLGETKGNGDCYPCMGCRAFLTPDNSGNGFNNLAKAKDYDGKPKYYGRFNIGATTLNLIDVALSAKTSKKDCPSEEVEAEFWRLIEERTELCHEVQKIRSDRLRKTRAEVAPILWCNGALARLDPHETLEKLIVGGYATSSLGYAGLYECVYAMTGESHTSPKGKKFGLEVMRFLNSQCAKWREQENISYSVYGTPLESTTYRFAKCLKKRFGEIENITNHDYVTNSYHINVREEIDAFSKLVKESEFQELSPGGAISYVEIPSMAKNIPAMLELIKFVYNHIMYAEFNTKIDYCMSCGFDGEIEIVDVGDGKLDWKCPNCGNMDHAKMNITRRTCGYLGSNYWNQGRTQEINERVLHL